MATLWVRSYCVYDRFEREWWSAGHTVAEHRRTWFLSGRGTVFLFRYAERVHLHEPPATRPASSVAEWKSNPAWRDRHSVNYPRHALHDSAPAWAKPMARLGLAYSQAEKHEPNRGDWPRGPITSTHHAGSVPYWLLVPAPASCPTVLLARRASSAWVGMRRRRAGRCAGCAYNPVDGIMRPIVYVQDKSGRRRSTETIRYYREAELRSDLPSGEAADLVVQEAGEIRHRAARISTAGSVAKGSR